jgi:O-antigen/teichoic acid export membrane protein
MKKIASKLHFLMFHPLARGSAIVLAGSLFGNVGAFVYTLLIGRILGPVRYGELASLFSFSYMLNVPSIVMQTVLTRYIAGSKADGEIGRAKTLAISAAKALVVVVIVGSLVMMVFAHIIAEFLHIQENYSVWFMYIASSFALLTTVEVSLLQGFQLFAKAVIYSGIGVIIRTIGGITGAFFGVASTAFANSVTSGLGFLIYLIPLGFVLNAKAKSSAIVKKEFLVYSIPAFLSILGITSLYSSDILLAKHFLSSFDAGQYAALSIMGKIVFFASSSVAYVMLPVVAERSKSGVRSQKLVYAALGAIAMVSFGITVGYFLLPKLALQILFGKAYFSAAPYLGLFGIFLSLYSLSNLLVTTFLGAGNNKVWIFVLSSAFLQIIGIYFYHTNVVSVIWVNITVTCALFVSLLLYYRHVYR